MWYQNRSYKEIRSKEKFGRWRKGCPTNLYEGETKHSSTKEIKPHQCWVSRLIYLLWYCSSPFSIHIIVVRSIKHTRVINISGLIVVKQIFMIKIGFVVFQNILHNDQYTFAWFWTNFSNPIQVIVMHAVWMHQLLLWVPKIVDYIVYFWCVRTRKSNLVLYGGWPISFRWSKIPLFDPKCEGSCCHDEERFTSSVFCEFLWWLLTNKWLGAIQNWPKATVATWLVMPKKQQATICFHVLPLQTTFVGFRYS